MNINTFYSSIIQHILIDGHKEVNLRTGVETAALPGITYETDLQEDGFPLLSLRKISTKAFVAEQMWFISGQKDATWLSAHTKIWDLFKDDNNQVSSAYGYRWRQHFMVDQLAVVVQKLKDDPTTRHAVLMMWDPPIDLIVKQKNVPCPVMCTLNIIGGRLHMHLIVRSNDMVLGFPTDVAGFALLQCILAQELGVLPGKYTHSISNAHIYKNHYDAAKQMVNRYFMVDEDVEYDPWNKIGVDGKDMYKRAERLDETLFNELVDNFDKQYKPLPPISNLTIAL